MEKIYKIRLASYKNSKSVFGGLIRFKQRYFGNLPTKYARFSHSEVVFCFTDDKDILNKLEKIENIRGTFSFYNDYKNTHLRNNFKDKNLWFSSEEGTGSRFKFIEDNKNNWVFQDFIITKAEYIKVLDFAISQDNNAYNWFGIFFNQTLKLNIFRKKGDWFCSQIAGRLLQVLNGKDRVESLVGIDTINVSPGRLKFLVK